MTGYLEVRSSTDTKKPYPFGSTVEPSSSVIRIKKRRKLAAVDFKGEAASADDLRGTTTEQVFDDEE